MQEEEKRESFGDAREEKSSSQPLSKTHRFSADAPPFDPTKVGLNVVPPVDKMMDVGSVGGPWSYQSPYMVMPNMGRMPMYKGTGVVPYGNVPLTHPMVPTNQKKEGGEKEGLSVHAKPWSPFPENAAEKRQNDGIMDTVTPSWVNLKVGGKTIAAPAPMISTEESRNLFVHSFPVIPRSRRKAELEMFNYQCARCPLKTLFGKLSSRKADVSLKNIATDVPPLCVAHMVEQITKAKVTALCTIDGDLSQYEMWLDKPNMSLQVVGSLSGNLWTCPFAHGYAVYPVNAKGKEFISEYLEQLRNTPEATSSAYPLVCVEAKEH